MHTFTRLQESSCHSNNGNCTPFRDIGFTVRPVFNNNTSRLTFSVIEKNWYVLEFSSSITPHAPGIPD